MFGASMNSDQNIFIAIAPNSPASKAGLEVGDRLIQFNDKPIYTGKDFDAAVDASPRRAKLLIMKQEQ
ncbi:MAG: PDZ domain-containing protein, partial [Planctomycetia bacterium]|nr:PDZ domain-containing protein [Planctomycetia bacterium]